MAALALVLALVLFLLVTFGVSSSRINLQALGLALVVFSMLAGAMRFV